MTRSTSAWGVAIGVALTGVVWTCADASGGPAPSDVAAAGPLGRREARVELGRRLFFDPAVSRSGANACVKCHAPDHGFSDERVLSPDEGGNTRRHSQTLYFADRAPGVHWAGEFPTVQALVLARLTGGGRIQFGGPASSAATVSRPTPTAASRRGDRPTSVGGTNPRSTTYYDPLAGRTPVDVVLREQGLYGEAFEAGFGTDEISLPRIAEAIAAYVASLRPTRSPYDRHVAGEADALSESAKRGLALFKGRAGCADCHRAEGRNAAFTDFRFHDTGLSWKLARNVPHPEVAPKATKRETRELGDMGRAVHTAKDRDVRAFKTPSLRDVALRAPYMHDGSLATLKQVVEYYADGCSKDPWLSKEIAPFRASEEDVADLVAFLESLTGERRPGLAETRWSARAARTRLVFVSKATGDPLRDVEVRISAAGDVLPGATPGGPAELAYRTDAGGAITYDAMPWTHVRVVTTFDAAVAGVSGRLVPDTCREARIVLDVPQPVVAK